MVRGAAPEGVEICLDRDGLTSLLSQPQLLKNGHTEHVHLMSESWGDAHLEEHPKASPLSSASESQAAPIS